jgi:hypothetical protein
VRILRCQPQRVSCVRQLHRTVASDSCIRQWHPAVASGSCNSLSGAIPR